MISRAGTIVEERGGLAAKKIKNHGDGMSIPYHSRPNPATKLEGESEIFPGADNSGHFRTGLITTDSAIAIAAS